MKSGWIHKECMMYKDEWNVIEQNGGDDHNPSNWLQSSAFTLSVCLGNYVLHPKIEWTGLKEFLNIFPKNYFPNKGFPNNFDKFI